MAVFGEWSQGRQEDIVLSVTVSGSNISGWILDEVFRRRPMGAVWYATSGVVVSGSLGTLQVSVPSAVFSGLDPNVYFLESWRNTSGTASFLAGDYVCLLPTTKRSG